MWLMQKVPARDISRQFDLLSNINDKQERYTPTEEDTSRC